MNIKVLGTLEELYIKRDIQKSKIINSHDIIPLRPAVGVLACLNGKIIEKN